METDLKHITSSAQNLEAKILKCHPEKIKTEKGKTRREHMVFSSSLSTEEACRTQYSKVISDDISSIFIFILTLNLCFYFTPPRNIKWEHWELPN